MKIRKKSWSISQLTVRNMDEVMMRLLFYKSILQFQTVETKG